MSTSLAPRRPLRSGRLLAASATVVSLIVAGCSSSPRQPTGSGSASQTGGAVASSPTESTAAPTSAAPVSSGPASSSASAIPAGFRPGSVTFVSATAGFVIGSAPCASGTCTLVVKTTDAGHTWAAVGTVPAPLSGTNTAVTKLRYADAFDGWAFDPQLWATHDGGRSWHQIGEPGQVYDVEAAGGSAYALVAACTAQPCADGPALLRTPVGSDGWAPVAGVQLAPGTSGGTIALHGPAVWLATAGQGVAHLLSSPDGATWHSLGDPCTASGGQASGAPWVLAGVAPVSSTSVFLLCGGGAAAGSQQKRVLYSTDGGAHSAPTATDPPFGGDLQGIAAASAQVVTVVARSGASWVYRSADGGHTWSAALQQGDGGVGYFDVGFTTATQGVAIYGTPGQVATQLLMTRDAGATWAPASFS